MRESAFLGKTCAQCGTEIPTQATGRPGIYCTTRCRQAASRERRTRKQPPDTRDIDGIISEAVLAIQDDLNKLLHSLPYSDAQPMEPLRLHVRIQNHLEALTAVLVHRSRLRDASWGAIGDSMNLSQDTVRHKYGKSPERHLGRYLERYGRRMAHPHQATRPTPSTRYEPEVAYEEGESPPTPARPTDVPESPTLPSTELAVLLSGLQRDSGLTLRALSKQAHLSPGYLSRVLSGERVPSWAATVRVAQACGVSPSRLCKAWQEARTGRSEKKEPPTLRSALHFLHQRAGQPSAAQIVATSHYALRESEVTALLTGNAVSDWATVQRLVFALDGEPSYFEPLWADAQARDHGCTSQPSLDWDRLPPSRPSRQSQPGQRLGELLTTLGPVLNLGLRATDGESVTGLHSAGVRRACADAPQSVRPCLPTPVQAVTHWCRRPSAGTE